MSTIQRRHFVMGAAATAGMAGVPAWGKTIKHKPLDPVNP
ncbi:MAG: hypothetical protein JWN16_1537, partial [Alphaproteobacteria bacterium]|nr:hypothetical protein [Alphaproteobacteria bacterium]